MSIESERTALQLRSLVKRDGTLQVSLLDVAVARPGPNEVLIRMEAAPLNPSDLGLLFGAADMSTAAASGSGIQRVVTARIPAAAMKGLAARIDISMPVGNEGAGLVVEAGSSGEAQALLGKRVAAPGGAMYAQYRNIACDQCLVYDEAKDFPPIVDGKRTMPAHQ
jgi:NADPH2:quinone reductase